MMYQLTLICTTLLWVVRLSTELQCTSSDLNTFKLSIASRRNVTGHWIAQVELKHGIGRKDSGPWEMDVDHTTAKCEDAETVLVVATVRAPPQRPSADYELLPGLGYYKIHTIGKNWHDARQTCVKEGAQLVILNSDYEAASLAVLWQKYPKLFSDWRNDWGFVGIHDLNVEGEFVTIFNQPLNHTGFSKWHTGQPNGGNCGVILRGTAGLGDVNCKDELAFFCELGL